VEAVGNHNPESGRRNDPDQLKAAGLITPAAELDTSPDPKTGLDPKIGLGPATIN
jgi:hypothetical protein